MDKDYEIEILQCPQCGKPIETRWALDNGGLFSNIDYVLAGDLIFHSKCWDKQLAEHPPFDGSIKVSVPLYIPKEKKEKRKEK